MTPRRPLLLVASLSLAAVSPLLAQSQAINGSIEGTIRDTSGAVLPGVTLTITNVDTGLERALSSGPEGSYKAVLLPLGAYRLRAELGGFKTADRSGITLSAGQTAVINVTLELGAVEEIISVTAESPVADPAKIDLGRTIGATEVKNLPLVARNPYNFALIQPNVTGYENEEFGATRMNANGTQMRTNYQIDGSSATQKNRAGLRMFQPSEIMIKEIKVITSGFAPEFGQTTGMVFNAITPSGSNEIRGHASYRFRRSGLSARPFLLSEDQPKPSTSIDNITAALGGPLTQDRWHFYLGYEWRKNDLSNNRVITVTPETATLLGLGSEALGDGVIPAVQSVDMFMAKLDGQINHSHRLSARWALFKNETPENTGGGLNTREVAPDFQDRMDSASLQLISNLGTSKLNELRIGFGSRNNPREPTEVSGPGPRVSISGVANFGGYGTGSEWKERFWQLVDNFSILTSRHSIKFGIDLQLIEDSRQNNVVASYTFPTTEAYLAAREGTDPFGYTRFSHAIGDRTMKYTQRYFSAFVQDDFRLSDRFKLLFGVRYDLFLPPEGIAEAPHPWTREFGTDKNNLAPRVGFSWTLDDETRTVLRASVGLMYEPLLGRAFEDALTSSGTPRFLSLSMSPTEPGAPPFPSVPSSPPPGAAPSGSIHTLDPEYANQYTWLTNVQLERAFGEELSLAVGYVNSTGRGLPISLSSNYLPSGLSLGDGRPIYDRSDPVNPLFNRIRELRSTGRSRYNALTLALKKRMSHGFQAQASYTLAKAEDHGLGGGYVVGSIDQRLTDPSDQDRDWGPTAWDTRHNFMLSAVIAPQVEASGTGATILNHNQLGIIVQANSGLPYNIRSNLDLNNDGNTGDRPNGIGRNSGGLGSVFNLDARYSRFLPLGGDLRLELFAEAKNLLNNEVARGVNSVVRTDAFGEPESALPSRFDVTSTYQARQFQLGVKLEF